MKGRDLRVSCRCLVGGSRQRDGSHRRQPRYGQRVVCEWRLPCRLHSTYIGCGRMPFGTLLASSTQVASVPKPLMNGQPIQCMCDGGTRPNPGVSRPVVFDGTKLLAVAHGISGNHQAVYDAVEAALRHAIQRSASAAEISMFSRLVWSQITFNGGCDELKDSRDLVVALASRLPSVTWCLVEPPLSVGARTIGTRRAFRRLGAGTSKPAVRQGHGTAFAGASSSGIAIRIGTLSPISGGSGTAGLAPASPGP